MNFTARKFYITHIMNDRRIAFLFPGQGSQTVGMGKALAETYPIAKELFLEADELLGFPLSQMAWEGPEDCLNDTINTQPALFIHSIAVLYVLRTLDTELLPVFVAGHSMGELSALVAAGALTFSEGLKLVRTRGELMKRAGDQTPGGMAAVMGLDIPRIEELCHQASSDSEIVQVANDNCPGQVVISGANAALDRLQPLLEQAGARRVIRLAVSIAAHSPYMSAVQNDFNRAITSAQIRNAFVPIISNISARPMLSAVEIMNDLQNQLTHRVRWTESIQYLISQGVTELYEIGSGAVLCGLVKRIDRLVAASPLGSPPDFEHLK